MSNPKQAAQGSAATAKEKLTFKQMTGRQKTVFVLKLTVSILSFGMLFPNLMSDSRRLLPRKACGAGLFHFRGPCIATLPERPGTSLYATAWRGTCAGSSDWRSVARLTSR